MSGYKLHNDRFEIKDFDIKKTFSSFLPGIAGVDGIPFWCFYVNRGQGISGFGIKDKSCPIMEFSPASIAYSRVNHNGFRTFIKADGNYFEPFGIINDRTGITRTMQIFPESFSITERNEKNGILTKVTYFGLPQEPFSALVRNVEITNISGKKIKLEICDGLAELLPLGISNNDYKSVGNLLRSWMTAEFTEGAAIYKMRSSTSDSAEVKSTDGGHFYTSGVSKGKSVKVVNPKLIFGHDSSKTIAHGFIKNDAQSTGNNEHIFENELPCAFTAVSVDLDVNESVNIVSLIGTFFDIRYLRRAEELTCVNACAAAFERSKGIVRAVTDSIYCNSANARFDSYIKQCYLDNVLRGGMPVILDDKKDGLCYYIYSRKHGDLERDYNWFVIEPSYYSSGNGNFRDVLQNRRNDVFFCPESGLKNIEYFTSLIQADGGNPLSVNGVKFRYNGKGRFTPLAQKVLGREFSYGELYTLEKEGKIESAADVLKDCSEVIKAEFSEGYWTDHFVYLADLLDSFESVFPDRLQEMLFDTKVKYFVSPAKILPLSQKSLLKEGVVRRYGAIDEKETKRNAKIMGGGTWAQFDGKDYSASVASKLFNLVVIKMATLDAGGTGLDMEADKPGWNDAMNGLPALFSSSVTDLIELKRLIKRLAEMFEKCGKNIDMTVEQSELYLSVLSALDKSGMDYYKAANDAKEAFREKIYTRGIIGTASLKIDKALEFLYKCDIKLENNLKVFDGGIIPTYICYEATDYDLIKQDGKEKLSHYGLPCVDIKKLEARELPVFLESEAKYLYQNPADAKFHYEQVKKSGLYDDGLKVFKTSISLANQSQEIGRIRSFVEGWLERESCFLHMDYKYLYGMLRAGLYGEFFEEIKTNLVCNMDAEKYGRNILENSTFIVTGNHCDKEKTGQGFQPRLTGANPEMLSMFILMMSGGNMFTYKNGQLEFSLRPKLSAEMFDTDNKVSFSFYKNIPVTIYNPKRLDTYSANIKYKLAVVSEGKEYDCGTGAATGDVAKKIRDGICEKITVTID